MIERALELFERRGWRPFEFQRATWEAFGRGEDVLVHAPTGLGKTDAALLGPALEALAGDDAAPGLRVLWITPLRALARDLARSIEATARELGLAWRVETRCSDTTSSVRKRQRERLPEVLVTTPESLSLLLSQADGETRLAPARCVVVDEWHELLGTKRGVQVELALSRLRSITRGLRTIGLSASLGDPREALDVLAPRRERARTLVESSVARPIEVVTLVPDDVGRLPWAGHLGLSLLPRVVAALEPSASSLVFANTRFQAEAWFRELLSARPDWAGLIALHHGSMDRKLREGVERLLLERRVKVVVCTSSLDLGVDFPAVEQVVQIGSPKGLARFVQRAGRSGHRPGATPRIVCVPTHALELAEFAAARNAVARGELEPRPPLDGPLDVLVQHVVTLASGAGLDPERTYAEVRSTHAFRALDRATWSWTLDFAGRGGAVLAAYPQFARLVERDGLLVAATPRHASLHRANIGTITADGAVEVRFATGGRLGEVEEAFAARRSAGDVIRFAGRELEVVALRDMRLVVRRAKKRAAAAETPRWMGGRMPLSSHLGAALRREIADRASWDDSAEMRALVPLLELQALRSRVPAADEVLVEVTSVRGAPFACVFPFEGRAVHDGLASLVALRLSRLVASTYSTSITDYGLALEGAGGFPLDADGWRELCRPEHLDEDLAALLERTDLARRRFRGIARVAGLVVQGAPGRRRRVRDLQASSGLVHDVFVRHDPANPLLAQARREVLDHDLDVAQMRRALERISAARWHVATTERLTPFSFPLWAESVRGEVSSESWDERVRRMALSLTCEEPRHRARTIRR